MNATGHMLVARIAWDRMTPKTQAAVKALAADQNNPQMGKPTGDQDADPFAAAVWFDDIKPAGHDLHFVNTPLDGNGDLPPGNNSVSTLQHNIAILNNPKAGKDDKAEAMRITMHLVGDAHQPLHDSDNHDRGGNSFKLNGSKNLHGFWDAGGDQWGAIARPLDEAGQKKLASMASNIEQQYPYEKLAKEAADLDPSDWAHEGWELSKKDVYVGVKEGQAPSPEYRAKTRDDMNHEAALAGYRLANILNAALG